MKHGKELVKHGGEVMKDATTEGGPVLCCWETCERLHGGGALDMHFLKR
jgi:hypothetical protein